MKSQLILMIMAAFCSATAFADESTIKCYLTAKGDSENGIAITFKQLSNEGSAHVTEADNLLENPQTEFAFDVVVQNNVMTDMRLEDKVNHLVTEQNGLSRDSYMEVSLVNQDGPVKLMCFLNVL